jgi:hypothetical protein
MSNIHLTDSDTFIFQTVLVSETPVLEILYIIYNRKNANMWLTCQEGVLKCLSADIPHKSSENSEIFKYLGTAVTNQNNIHEEISVRRKSGTACYTIHFRIILFPPPCNNKKTKIYRATISPVGLCNVGNLSLTLRKDTD